MSHSPVDSVSGSDSVPSGQSTLRLAVLGGGITGQAAAHRLQELSVVAGRPVSISLFEASDRLGGAFGTERIGDYLVERGADSFITNKPAAVKLCRRLGMEDRLIPTNARFRSSLILSNGKPVPTPDGFQLVAPGDLKAVLRSPLLSWPGKLRILAERFIPRRTSQEDESVAGFVRRRVGKEALDRLVQPLVGGIYTSNPEHLSAQTTLQRFLTMEQKHGSLYRGMRVASTSSDSKDSASGARYGLFASFPNGMQELLDTLEERIRSTCTIRVSTPVRSLRKNAHGWELQTDDGRELYDGVIVALSAPVTAKLLENVDSECATAISQIECASSAIVLTGHALSDVKHPLDSFGLVIPHRENRRILAVSFLSRKFDDRAPAGRVCLRTFVGGAMQPEEYKRTDDEIIETVLSELRSILGVTGTPDFTRVARYPQGMPQFHVGHLQRVQEIRKKAESLTGLKLAGNYFEGVGVPDCIQSGEQAADQLFQMITDP